MTNPYRGLPSVDRVLQHDAVTALRARFPEALVTAQARAALESARALIGSDAGTAESAATRDGAADAAISVDGIAASVVARVEETARASLRPVINASGVILHTNLGRAPLPESAIEAMAEVGRGYSNLEFDLAAGERGSRLSHLDRLLQATTGAEAGLVINNNASALMFVLTAFALEREVIISRGQAVEIGGGFRIPDVCRQSGARLVEVGTTNRTRASDYGNAVSEDTAALMRVHASNFKIVGFTEEPSLRELRSVASEHGILFLDDIGSGCLLDTTRYGLAPEPTPQESLAAGADLVLFSGDKLLGGPQAGIIVGRAALIDQLRRHPLARALRSDKATTAALAATLRHYLLGEAESEIPVWRMISASAERMRERAEAWRGALDAGQVEASESMIGGGSLPGEGLPTFVLAIAQPEPHRLAAALRRAETPVVGRVERESVLLDPRTVAESEEAAFLATVRSALG
ncbi:MAG: L-seryl-tRNA(Ser) seleniumtransferase [Chloroflexi bacterium]|nr:MAG: L-seryl-tRNA(Ser) seleniumtransferase [Chloroflexota bacterium]